MLTIFNDFDRMNRATNEWRPLLRQLDLLFNELTPATSEASPVDFSPNYDVQEAEDSYHLVVFTLPEGVLAEHVEADHKDVVLTPKVAKPEAARPTKIKIGEASAKPNFIKNLIGERKGEPAQEASH